MQTSFLTLKKLTNKGNSFRIFKMHVSMYTPTLNKYIKPIQNKTNQIRYLVVHIY